VLTQELDVMVQEEDLVVLFSVLAVQLNRFEYVDVPFYLDLGPLILATLQQGYSVVIAPVARMDHDRRNRWFFTWWWRSCCGTSSRWWRHHSATTSRAFHAWAFHF